MAVTPGFVMLAHENLDRAAQLARFLAGQGCPVAVHVDARVPADRLAGMRSLCDGRMAVRFTRRLRSEWGSFAIVRATQEAAGLLLREFPHVSHVALISGACLPVRALDDLRGFLAAHPDTDFIESVDLRIGAWVQDGLSEERFTLRFPLSWRRHRWLFDRWVEVQRRLGLRRRLPPGIEPHLGSQWWCLTRRTLQAILEDPRRREFDRFFRWSWIPDETYFQTLARRHALRIDSRSLTFSRFDHWGRPHLFYDDHAELLVQTDHFFARKIWRGAEGLYARFLDPAGVAPRGTRLEPRPVERPFAEARQLRCEGRPGVLGMGRFPCRWHSPQQATPRPYLVFDGFDALLPGWHRALGAPGRVSHGRLFAPDRVEFADGAPVWTGNLPANPRIRDRAPDQFLIALLRHEDAAQVSLQLCPGDHPQMMAFIARDPNARILRLEGAELLAAFRAGPGPGHAPRLAPPSPPVTAAAARIWHLADLLADPAGVLGAVLAEAWGEAAPVPALPLPRLDGLADFAARLGHADAPRLRAAERARLGREARDGAATLRAVGE
ncbi:MAG: glycosyl transferase [Alphaproteobacteria bacterium]|nr:MAG: glycosyl transferase [Alphaproteobacteria bacterium]